MAIISQSFSKNISLEYSISNDTQAKCLNIKIIAFSTLEKKAQIEISYKHKDSDEWNVANNILHNAINPTKNIIIPCSLQGAETIVKWFYKQDLHPNIGVKIDLKVEVVPTPRALTSGNASASLSIFETHEILDNSINYQVIGIDKQGNYICKDNRTFIIDSQTNKEIVSVNRKKTSFATGSFNGFILVDNNGTIEEFNYQGEVINSISSNKYKQSSFYYNEYAKILLIACRNNNLIEEVFWSKTDCGEVLWNKTFVEDVFPTNPVYANNDLNAILFCNEKEYKLVSFYKLSNEMEFITDENYATSRFVYCVGDENIYVAETDKKQHFFSTAPETHIAMQRMKSLSGMTYIPLVGGF